MAHTRREVGSGLELGVYVSCTTQAQYELSIRGSYTALYPDASSLRLAAQSVLKDKVRSTRWEDLSSRTQGSLVSWPAGATFAVSGSAIRRQPRPLFEELIRMITVEHACPVPGTRMQGTSPWGHTLERLWFEILGSSHPHGAAPLGS